MRWPPRGRRRASLCFKAFGDDHSGTARRKMKTLNCTLSFIDVIHFEHYDFDPGPVPGPKRPANYEKAIINVIRRKKYPDLILDIHLDEYDREGADFSARVHFSASSLEEFVTEVARLADVCSIAPNSFAARYARYRCLLMETDFCKNGEVKKPWLQKMKRCVARNDVQPNWDADMWLL